MVVMLWFCFSKLVRAGELHGTQHVREEATVIALDLLLCAQWGVTARPCVSECVSC